MEAVGKVLADTFQCKSKTEKKIANPQNHKLCNSIGDNG